MTRNKYKWEISDGTLKKKKLSKFSRKILSLMKVGEASLSTSGLYTCLVTGGDIPFLEDSDTKTVMVASEWTINITETVW